MIHLSAPLRSSLLFLACAALLVPTGDRFRVQKISGPMVGTSSGDAQELEFTSDGTRVVYSANATDVSVLELYAAPVDGSASPTRLNAITTVSYPFSSMPTAFRVSPDGSRVVYRSDPDGNQRFEILSVPTDASAAPVTLNAQVITDRNVEPEFLISPDGQYVLYRADQEQYQQVELYSVPIDGSSPTVRLNMPPVTGGDVAAFGGGVFLGFQVSADSQWVVYMSDEEVDGQSNLHRVPIDGSSDPVILNDTLGGISGHLLSPDGMQVLYRQIVAGVPKLLAVPIDGSSAPVVLASGASLPFGITPDGQRVLYETTAGALFSRPVDASAPAVRLDAVPVTGGSVVEFRIAPDGQRVVYLADSQVDERFELFSAPTDGASAAVKLNGTLVAGGDVFDDDIFGFAVSLGITPDSSRVVYIADQQADERLELYSVPIAGGTPLKLHPTLGTGRDVVQSLRLSSDGERVLFRADVVTDDVFELYSAAIDGSGAVKLNAPLPAGGNLLDDDVGWGYTGFEISPDGLSVAYIADQTVDGRHEIYGVPIDGSASPAVLNDPFPIDAFAGDVTHVWVEGHGVVYLADQDVDGVFELYGRDLRSSAPAVKLNGALPTGGSVVAPTMGAPDDATVRLTPDGSRVVYLADQDVNDVFELYSAPTDGSAATVKLNPALADLRDVQLDFEISRDGSRVVYTSDQELNNRTDLYSVPTDGSAAAVRLSLAHSFSDVLDFHISNDGLGVAYLADQGTDGVVELYVVDIQGTQAPVKRNAGLAADEDVRDFRFAANDQHLVYTTSGDVGPVELFAVPVFGSAPAWKLNGPLAAGSGGMAAYAISSDGATVVYMAVQDVAGVRELYSVPIDGSAAPTRLNAPMSVGHDVFDFAISADSARVVYLASQDAASAIELFTVPIDGASAPVKLNPALAPTRDVRYFRLSADGTHVAFVQENASGQPTELYGIRTDASSAAVRLNDPPLSGGSVERERHLSIHGPYVYYVARDAASPRTQLYRVPISGGVLPTQVSSQLVQTNNTWPLFTVTDGGRSVFYRDDAEIQNTAELYQATFAPTKASPGRVPPF